MQLSRRAAIAASAGAAASAFGVNLAMAGEQEQRKGKKNRADDQPGERVTTGGCVLMVNARGFSRDDIKNTVTAKAILESLLPVMASEMVRAAKAERTRGCSVSGTVTGASGGGVSGSATVTCTF